MGIIIYTVEILSLSFFFIAVFGLILSVLFKPSFSIGKKSVSCFYFVPLLMAVLMLCFSIVPLSELKDSFLSSDSINPLKILLLFFSMTSLSVYLDQSGFFSYLAEVFSSHFRHSQFLLFYGLYFLISLLTIFTSNDIIILTFTPFLILFCERNHLDPIPYLVMEFVASNTWSMVLIIGNPTNIYPASAFHISFFVYFKNMIFPTIATGLTSLLIMTLLFYRKLEAKTVQETCQIAKPKKVPVFVGIFLLLITTVFLSVSSYLGIEMYLVAVSAALILLCFSFIYSLITKENQIFPLAKALPWNLVPFMLSMFILVLGVESTTLYQNFRGLLLSTEHTFAYGLSSALVSNLINNIPMSVFYQPLLVGADDKALYATILSSNVSAFLTPLGALAGMMWMKLVKSHGIKMNYFLFMKYTMVIGLPSLLIGLTVIKLLTIA